MGKGPVGKTPPSIPLPHLPQRDAGKTVEGRNKQKECGTRDCLTHQDPICSAGTLTERISSASPTKPEIWRKQIPGFAQQHTMSQHSEVPLASPVISSKMEAAIPLVTSSCGAGRGRVSPTGSGGAEASQNWKQRSRGAA